MRVGRAAAGLLALSALCVLAPTVSWSQLTGQFEYPFSLAVDSAGNVYLSERQRNIVHKFDGNLGTQIWRSDTVGAAGTQFNGPSGIAVDFSGPIPAIHVADTNNARVKKLNATSGTLLAEWGSYGSGQGQFRKPIAIALAANNDIYVLDSELRRVQRFSNDGATFRGSFGTVGAVGTAAPGDGEFSPLGGGPRDLAVDAAGDIYVSDTVAHRIHKWRVVLSPLGNISSATFLGWGGRCAGGTNCIQNESRSRGFTCTAATCTPATTNPSLGTGNGQFILPAGLGLDSQGNLFVADFDNNRVQKFAQNGDFLLAWGTLGAGPDQFRGPLDVAAFGTTAVYVADMRNKRISRFGPTGGSPSTVGGEIYLSATRGYPPANIDALTDVLPPAAGSSTPQAPLFVLPGTSQTTTVSVESFAGFAGNVTLLQTCCTGYPTGPPTTPALPTGVTVNLSGGGPTFVGPNAPATSTMTIAANSSPAGGRFHTALSAGNPTLNVSRQAGIVFEIVAPLADGTTVPCPGFYQRGGTPEVLPLSAVLLSVFNAKLTSPGRVTFVIAAASSTDRKTGWEFTIDWPTGINPPLAPTEMLLFMNNTTTGGKGILSIDGRTCGPAGTGGFVLSPGQSRTVRLSSATTTTLVFSRPTQDLAVFAQENFWTMFGGRRLSVRWIEL